MTEKIYQNAGRVQRVETIASSENSAYDETADANKVLPVDSSGTAISSTNLLPVTVIDDTGKVSPAGELITNAPYANIVEQSPTHAHVLDEQPFNAKAVDGPSTAIDVLQFGDCAFTLTDAICDGTLTVEDELGATLSFLQNNVVVTSIVCAGSGTNYHHCQLVNCVPKKVIFKLAGRSTGSISVDIRGN